MKREIFGIQELCGVFVTFLLTLLSWTVYSLFSKGTLWILLGAVNNSIWEKGKGIVFSYIFYGLYELVTSKPYFKQFVVAKFTGLYTSFILYIALRSLFYEFYSDKINLIFGLLALCTGFFVSFKLTTSDYPLKNLFPTACFMILLLFVLCFSFTAFPPYGAVFQDPETGLCGIVPDYVDVGAIILDKLYG